MKKKKLYTIYKITNLLNGMIYIGQHVTENLNDSYMGSSKYLKRDIIDFGLQNFKKEILFIFETKEEMIAKEKELVNKEFTKRIDTYNRSLGGGGLYTLGQVSVKDKEGNTLMVSIQDPRYLNGELIGISKNTVTVKDKNDNYLKVLINDPKYLSGELKHNSKNQVTVKDKEGNIFNVSKKDQRYLSGELKYVFADLICVKDKSGNKFQIHKDDFLKNNNVHGILYNRIKVYDKNGKGFFVERNDSRYLSGELKKKLMQQ